MTTVQLSDKWQITVPASVRKTLGLKRRGRMEAQVQGDTIVLRPIKSIREVYGVFRDAAKDKPLDWDEAREQMYRAVAEEYEEKNGR